MTNIFTRTNILNVLLALCTAIEFAYDMGERFGTWWQQGGREELIKALALTITAIVWTVTTVRLGYAVVKRDAPVWASNLNTARHRISRAFSYEYTAA